MEPRYYTQRELARLLQVSIKTLQRRRRARRLRFIKFGHRSIRIPQSEVERLLRAATLGRKGAHASAPNP